MPPARASFTAYGSPLAKRNFEPTAARPQPAAQTGVRAQVSWYVRGAMRRGLGSTIVVALAAAVLGGCGGARQDVNEPNASFPVQMVTTRFPSSQRLAEHTHLVISVRNAGTHPIPDLTVTICNITCRYPAPVGAGTSVAAFSQYFTMPGVASHSRPVWIVDKPPGVCGYSCQQGGEGADATAASNSWQRGGPLAPGATATFDWGVTAVAPGKFVVAWEIAAGQYGKAKAVLASGSSACGKTPCGTLPVKISQTPAQAYVNDAGQIVPGSGQ